MAARSGTATSWPATSSRRCVQQACRQRFASTTCATPLISLGANPKQIQDRLGHSTIQLTFDRYGHLFEGHDERLRNGLDELYAEAAVSRSCHESIDVDVAAQPEREMVPVTRDFLERTTGFEPATPTLARLCSTN